MRNSSSPVVYIPLSFPVIKKGLLHHHIFIYYALSLMNPSVGILEQGAELLEYNTDVFTKIVVYCSEMRSTATAISPPQTSNMVDIRESS